MTEVLVVLETKAGIVTGSWYYETSSINPATNKAISFMLERIKEKRYNLGGLGDDYTEEIVYEQLRYDNYDGYSIEIIYPVKKS